MNRFLLIRLALVALILFGSFLVCFQASEFFKARQSKSWPNTIGILSVETGEYGKNITYRYSVDGVIYSSDRVIFGELGNRVRSKEWAAVSDSPDGSELTVYYNPDDPLESSLFTTLLAGSWFDFLIGAIFLLAGSFFLVLISKMKRIAE